MSDWTEARIATLKRMWADGATTAVIAAVLEVSRNAVIGKSYRLDLPSRAPKPAANRKAAPRAKPAAPRVQRARPPKPEAAKVAKVATPATPTPLPPSPGLFAIGVRQCRWVLGDPRAALPDGPLVCGAKVAGEGSSYCPQHHAVAHRCIAKAAA